jgi:leucyl-tRNA synthetase
MDEKKDNKLPKFLDKKRILVTSALPYANGSIHIV